MNVTIRPGEVRVAHPTLGTVVIPGVPLAQLECAAEMDSLSTEQFDEVCIDATLDALERMIPGTWAWYEQLPEHERDKLPKLFWSFDDISRQVVSGNTRPLERLLDICEQVRKFNQHRSSQPGPNEIQIKEEN